MATQNPSYGTPATAPIEPTRSGYTFSGWHVGSATGPAWDETAAVFGPVTVFASWTAVGGGGSGGQGTDDAQRLAATGSAGGSALVHHGALAGGLLLAAGALVLVRGRSRAAGQR